MIYDELIEELALTLLTKARYEGCISVIDGFSQCEEDKTRIEYPIDGVMRIMPVGSEIWPEECEPLLKKIGAETIGDVADYLNKSKSENSSADDVLFTALLKICYENMDMDGKMVFWEDMLENNSLECRRSGRISPCRAAPNLHQSRLKKRKSLFPRRPSAGKCSKSSVSGKRPSQPKHKRRKPLCRHRPHRHRRPAESKCSSA